MKQVKAEKLAIKKLGKRDYHLKQFLVPYRSTVKFCDWLESLGYLTNQKNLNLMDIGCGQGANLFYLAKRYPEANFLGIDLNPSWVKWGNGYLKKAGIRNGRLEAGDLYHLKKDYQGKYDGIVSLQTLSWLPDYKEPLESMLRLKPEWLALTSLFFEGDVTAMVRIHNNDPISRRSGYFTDFCYFNTYSLPAVRKLLNSYGYKYFYYVPFKIDVDLPRLHPKGMGTYTVKLKNGRRLQISGPLLLNWYFVVASRSKAKGITK